MAQLGFPSAGRIVLFAFGALITCASWPSGAAPRYVAIPLVLEGPYSTANSLNANGDVTGCIGSGTTHAFVYSSQHGMRDLGTLGGTSSCGAMINDAGEVTGTSQIAGDAVEHAFLFTRGKLVDLGTLGGTSSAGMKLNQKGQVAGGSMIAGDTAYHAFVYADGVMRDLGLDAQRVVPYGINARGDIAGVESVNQSGLLDRPFLWTQGKVIYLDNGERVSAGASDINDRGDVLGGGWKYLPSGGARSYVFLYRDGKVLDLGTLGGTNSYRGVLNSKGQVAGSSELASAGTHAFLYANGGMIDLGEGTTYAYGINAAGDVVGSGYRPPSTGSTTAFVYTEGATFDLNQLVVSGVGTARLTVTKAINDRGQIIAMQDIGASRSFRLDPIVPAVEFYNASLDHYFLTWVREEIRALDAGAVIKGWARTGQSIDVFPATHPGTSDICRYYIPPGLGDSHFFGRGTAECEATGLAHPTFVLEDAQFMHMHLPAAGVCPSGTIPVYRVFSARPDANHRYMTDRSLRDQMVAKGWLAEGDGPDLVAMCGPA